MLDASFIEESSTEPSVFVDIVDNKLEIEEEVKQEEEQDKEKKVFPWSLVTAKESSGAIVTDCLTKLAEAKEIIQEFGLNNVSDDDISDNEVTKFEEDSELSYPKDFLEIESTGPPKLPLRLLRNQPILSNANTPDPTTVSVTKKTLTSVNRFQPNDPEILLAALPIHEGNSWCDLSITCNDLLRLRAPFFFYDQRFDKLSKPQTESLEHWQINVHKTCDRQRIAMQYQLELCHSYNAILGHMRPKCWQTGLTDMGQTYAYRYKDMMKKLLGHDHHDRNSSREALVRYSIPYNMLDLEGLSPLEYLMRFCSLRETRLPYYQRIFTKYKDGRTHLIAADKLFEPLNALMSGSFHQEQADELVKILDIGMDECNLSLDEFCCIAALSERLFYTKNLRIFGEEGLAMQQGLLEISDFHMFVKKMDGVKITNSLMNFFQRLDLFK